ncbi:MAG: ankyrin repeat domain-containing protein [Candidatus Dependentiae bacterium]|nr:ankyrin repeat domain-containing protein [Candidatus Dependentiae bacterium]
MKNRFKLGMLIGLLVAGSGVVAMKQGDQVILTEREAEVYRNLLNNCSNKHQALVAATRHLGVVRKLIEDKADVNCKNTNKGWEGWTALHNVAFCYHGERHQAESIESVVVVNELVKAKADMDIKNKQGTSPLYYATQSTHSTDIAIALVNANADVNAEGSSEDSLLEVAVSRNKEMVPYLIKAGAIIRQACWTEKDGLVKQEYGNSLSQEYRDTIRAVLTKEVVVDGEYKAQKRSVLPLPTSGGHIALFDLVNQYTGAYVDNNKMPTLKQINIVQEYKYTLRQKPNQRRKTRELDAASDTCCNMQ